MTMYEICRVCGETAGAYVHDLSATAADVHPFEMAALSSPGTPPEPTRATITVRAILDALATHDTRTGRRHLVCQMRQRDINLLYLREVGCEPGPDQTAMVCGVRVEADESVEAGTFRIATRMPDEEHRAGDLPDVLTDEEKAAIAECVSGYSWYAWAPDLNYSRAYADRAYRVALIAGNVVRRWKPLAAKDSDFASALLAVESKRADNPFCADCTHPMVNAVSPVGYIACMNKACPNFLVAVAPAPLAPSSAPAPLPESEHEGSTGKSLPAVASQLESRAHQDATGREDGLTRLARYEAAMYRAISALENWGRHHPWCASLSKPLHPCGLNGFSPSLGDTCDVCDGKATGLQACSCGFEDAKRDAGRIRD